MSYFELVFIGVGLAMDAFAVSICKGLSQKNIEWDKAVICGLYFGIFQFLMPVIGFFLGYGFSNVIAEFDHWVAFVVLAAIGISAIRGALSDDLTEPKGHHLWSEDFTVGAMIPLAIATSIDALAVGVSFAFLRVNIWSSACLFGIITFILSIAGFKVGNVFGIKFKKKAELAGGVILILIGLKILMEHLLA